MSTFLRFHILADPLLRFLAVHLRTSSVHCSGERMVLLLEWLDSFYEGSSVLVVKCEGRKEMTVSDGKWLFCLCRERKAFTVLGIICQMAIPQEMSAVTYEHCSMHVQRRNALRLPFSLSFQVILHTMTHRGKREFKVAAYSSLVRMGCILVLTVST